MTTSRIEELEAQVVTFAGDNGFLGVRPERYKRCSIFVFQLKDRESRSNDYQSFTSFIMTKYSIPSLLPATALVAAGIYVYHYGKATQWAVPDSFEEVIGVIREHKPSWVFERLK